MKVGKRRADQQKHIADALAHLNVAVHPSGLALSGYRTQALKGELKVYWSVIISGNRHIIFRFAEGDAVE